MPRPPAPSYPLQFRPVLKDYPWGGRRIGTRLGRRIPPGPIAESWEISAHPDGPTTVANGPLAGSELGHLTAAWGAELVGTRFAGSPHRFPLLVKILDVREWLSVQVHPDDRWALGHENDLGKTEMWIVIEADPESELLLGLAPGTDRARLAEAVERGRTADCLHRLHVAAGDVLFVPPGTVHALGPGLLVAEIQQSSNVTYRLFDWNREPPRPLHVAEALEVIDFSAIASGPVAPTAVGEGAELLATCAHFRTERHSLAAGAERRGSPGGRSLEIWGVLAGAARLESGGGAVDLPAVSWTLLPATLGEYRLLASRDSIALRIAAPSS